MKITGAILNQITPALKGAYADSIANSINKVVVQYGMDTADILEDFIPNLLVESAEFTRFEENLNYSAARLKAVWPARFPNLTIATKYAHNPQALANKVYGGRLGNNLINDGWLLRGSGPLQGTGKEIMTKFAAFYNFRNSTSINAYEASAAMRDKVNIEMGLHFACWFFSIAKGLIPLAIADDFKGIVLRINGAYIGLDDRTRYYKRARIALTT